MGNSWSGRTKNRRRKTERKTGPLKAGAENKNGVHFTAAKKQGEMDAVVRSVWKDFGKGPPLALSCTG
jgi:hypothetical protein